MLIGILASIAPGIVGAFLDRAAPIIQAFQQGKISEAEMRAKLGEALMASFAEIEKAYTEALAKTWASFMDAVKYSRLMQAVWATVVLSQLTVLLWYQFGVPLLCYTVGNNACYPSAGTTVEWAYLLVGGLLGLGPMVLRAGPAAANFDKFKSMIGR